MNEQIKESFTDLTKKEKLIQIINQEAAANALVLKPVLENNLFAFNRHVLSIDKGDDKVPLSQVHRDLGQFIDTHKNKYKLCLIPRGHLKSTFVTVGRSVQAICKNPAVRILILNATYSLSCSFLTEIKRHLQYNTTLHMYWGDLTQNPETWKEDKITLNKAKQERGKKEPTVTAMGLESNMTSQHYDIVIMDDLVNKDYVNTQDQIQKSIDVYKEVLNLLEPGGEMIIVGTRWHDNDLYGYILDPDNNIIPDFKTFIKQSHTGSLENDDNFLALFPDKFNRKHLKKLYEQQGPYVFSCQYLNDPIPQEDANFRIDWFRYYEPTELRGRPMYAFTTIDPSLGINEDSDYTAIVTVSIDTLRNVYIREIVRARMNPNQINEHLFRIWNDWKPMKIGLEAVAYQKVLQYSLNEEMIKRGIYLPMVELKPGNRQKEQRIMGLQPLYNNGVIFHSKVTPGIKFLEDELLRFPRGKHDDVADSLAYGLDIWYPPSQKVSRHRGTKYLYD